MRGHLRSVYQHFKNYDNLDRGFDFSLPSNASSLPDLSILSGTNLRARFSGLNTSNSRNPFTVTRPIQLLNYICLENGWGEPEYHVTCIQSDPPNYFFVCVVLIPGFPVHNQKIMCDKISHSPDDAKHHGASYVLKKLGITDIDGPIASSTPFMNNGNSFLSPPKPFMSNNGSLSFSKTGASNSGFCSTPKPIIKTYKSQFPMPYSFGDLGQGDASSYFSSSQTPLDDLSSFDVSENDTPLLDPNTPIEPNSLLGLIASMAAASSASDSIVPNQPKP